MAAWRWHLGLGLGFTALALVMTWPLGSPAARVVPDMNDSFFNIWRLSWVAHQLVHQPTALFDANIFYPARHTLAYSDAMLLVGLAGAPFLWAGVPPAVVHNGLLIAALVSSAWASAVLAHRLTGDRLAAVLAGVIVGFAPYRFGHIAHLELQWLMWMPLALLALHALVERPRPAAGLALGASLAAQLLCSIYYGVFPRGLRRRRLDRAGGGARPEAAPRPVHGRRGDPARAGCGAVPPPVRRQPRPITVPARPPKSPCTARDRPTTWPCPPSTCCTAAQT
jgi:hypothetical protein